MAFPGTLMSPMAPAWEGHYLALGVIRPFGPLLLWSSSIHSCRTLFNQHLCETRAGESGTYQRLSGVVGGLFSSQEKSFGSRNHTYHLNAATLTASKENLGKLEHLQIRVLLIISFLKGPFVSLIEVRRHPCVAREIAWR